MNKNTNKNIDEIFKAQFEDFQVPPPRQNWEDLEKSIDTDLDQQFRDGLQPLQVTPQKKVWENVQEELPLHPKAKRYISWMTKIAAVLVIGMLLSILSDQQKQGEIAQNNNNSEKSTSASKLDISNHPLNGSLEQEKNTAFVYEVEKSSASKRQAQKYSRNEEAEMKNLLQFILEDDEDLAEMFDPKVINESLKPVEVLEEETNLARLEAAADGKIELEIKIPLIVVETEQEAANLIQLYESSHAPASKVD